MNSSVGLMLVLGALVIGSSQRLSVPESWREPPGDGTIGFSSSEPLSSASVIRNEPETPKFVVQSSPALPAGEPAPIGLTLLGRADGAVLTITGLVPGMELSTGDAVAPDTWQLSASDLKYVWVAPPPHFVGSADLAAELRLLNAEIADRHTIHLEWKQLVTSEPEQVAPPEQIEAMPPIAAAADEHAAPPQATPPQNQLYHGREASKSVRAHGKSNLPRSVRVGNRPERFPMPPVDDNTHAPKGFWDWSR